MSGSLYQRDTHALSRLQKLRFFPLAVTGGEGSYLIEEGGRRLLDFSASWGAASLGHANPALCAAVNRALETQAGASTLSAATEPTVALAERLLALTAESMNDSSQPRDSGQIESRQVWIGHSGSDANETVARAVAAATGRPRIISFRGAYHGGTAGSMAISAHSVQQHAEKTTGLHVIPYPDRYRADRGEENCDYIIDQLKLAFDRDCPPDEVAALFLEPIQSDGGLLVPPPGFMRALTSLCRDHGILVVSDEVKVGMGRSGLFNCIEHDEVQPDIVVLGKGLGGGLPLSAAIAPAVITDYATAFSMQTLHGNPVCTSAGLAVIETIESQKLMENAAKVGVHLQEKLRGLMAQHEVIGDVRGRGLAIGVELVQDRASKAPAASAAAKVVYRAWELGLVLFYVGMESNVLEITPPLILSVDEADQAVSILDQAFTDVEAGLVADAAVAEFEGW